MTDMDRICTKWKADYLIASANEDKNKGEPGSDLRRIGRRIAAGDKRAARLLRRYCTSGDVRYRQMASEILDGGDAAALSMPSF
jgi:hypothetical protein